MGVVSSEMVTAVNMFLFFLEAKSWMKYCGEAMLTEVLNRGLKLYSIGGSCIVNRERK